MFSDFIWTHPFTHQPIHPLISGGVSTDLKFSNRIEISWFVQVLLHFTWFGGSPFGWVGGMCRTCPTTHQTMHPPILICSSFIVYLLIWRSTLGGGWVVMGVCWGGDSSREFKSSNRIEISLFVQALLHFNWFGGPPLGVGGVVGCGCGCVGGCPIHVHMCIHAYMHTCMCTQWYYRVSPRGQPFAWNYHV